MTSRAFIFGKESETKYDLEMALLQISELHLVEFFSWDYDDYLFYYNSKTKIIPNSVLTKTEKYISNEDESIDYIFINCVPNEKFMEDLIQFGKADINIYIFNSFENDIMKKITKRFIKDDMPKYCSTTPHYINIPENNYAKEIYKHFKELDESEKNILNSPLDFLKFLYRISGDIKFCSLNEL